MSGGNIIGERFVAMSFGESHGRCVGMLVDGCPAGLQLSEEDIQGQLDRRKPGQSAVTTQRKEEDRVEILSGVFNGFTTGAPICMLIWNKDADSRAYEAIKHIPRPGHADYPAMVKYGGFADYRGSGRFSGRLTAALVMGGAVAQKLLQETLGIEIVAYTSEIGGIKADSITAENIAQRYDNDVRCPDPAAAEKMRDAILAARRDGDSLGGIVECTTSSLPVGLGEPIYASLEADLSKALFGIPAVKAVEFGSGFEGSKRRGSENNDAYYMMKDGKIVTRTNNSGGILGGLSNGMPLIVRVAFKPAASIAKTQETLDVSSKSQAKLAVPGRHDPCVVPRAPPIVECVVSMVLADHAIRAGLIPPVLKKKGSA
ncbi:chorismate synthase [Nitrososphaera viennensis]|uniref:Chorismate synthase n=2 Tax=Nitrososphaera viennensis TaxID=1034015 RepID=A0A060HMH8_9ARCH|nr:chorismate synthase [Nitrososphaera viennensis]AIC14776.1 chorismate synthase [Nitrososphaera viennensis EN76]UVS69731.1 chorismate synthase [Nitrososphaera viennensis]